MKKIFIFVLVIAMVCSLCACASAPEVPEKAESIGYALIPHCDGDECVDIWNWFIDDGVICVETMDGRFFASANIVIIEE